LLWVLSKDDSKILVLYVQIRNFEVSNLVMVKVQKVNFTFTYSEVIEGKSAASFCRQVAALVRDMFCNFYLVKNHKLAYNSAATEAKRKNKHIF
jgi:hypothetical protein